MKIKASQIEIFPCKCLMCGRPIKEHGYGSKCKRKVFERFESQFTKAEQKVIKEMLNGKS